jgi:hypothetical protein
MKNYLVIIIALLISCTSKEPEANPFQPLDNDKMISILVDRHLLLAEVSTFQYKKEFSFSSKDSILNAVILKHDVTVEEFEESWNYYLSDANEDLIGIYDKVIDQLKLLDAEKD